MNRFLKDFLLGDDKNVKPAAQGTGTPDPRVQQATGTGTGSTGYYGQSGGIYGTSIFDKNKREQDQAMNKMWGKKEPAKPAGPGGLYGLSGGIYGPSIFDRKKPEPPHQEMSVIRAPYPVGPGAGHPDHNPDAACTRELWLENPDSCTGEVEGRWGKPPLCRQNAISCPVEDEFDEIEQGIHDEIEWGSK